jgi:23S rRNA (cytidine1920-2'-O)/16S rRNA (cytidine1409-2'-O)-methyltransferase
MSRERLDNALVARGLVRSRSSGRDLVRRGFVLVDGVAEFKASRAVNADHAIRLKENAPKYVSRGAEKLLAGLAHFGYDCSGLRILDIGASTGGFTEVLLKNGAREVYAIDVGRGQLDASLRDDERVHNMEGVDSRKISGADIDAPVDALVCDVSFISLTKALTEPLMLVARGGWAIALVKPQFEAGPDDVGADGIVRSEAVQARVLEETSKWLASQSGWRVDGVTASPIAGGSGNAEFLIGARRDG